MRLPLPQHPLDHHSTYAKRLILIITHALVCRTRRDHSIHNLPSATRPSAAYTIISDSTSPAHAHGAVSGVGRILQAGNAIANTRDILHVEEMIETGVPQTAQIVWLGVRERSYTIAAVLSTLQNWIGQVKPV